MSTHIYISHSCTPPAIPCTSVSPTTDHCQWAVNPLAQLYNLTASLSPAGSASACPHLGRTPNTSAALCPYSPCRASAPTSTCACATSTAKGRASECKGRLSVIRVDPNLRIGPHRSSEGLQDFGPQSDSLNSKASSSFSFFVCLRLIISYVSSLKLSTSVVFPFVFCTLRHVVLKFHGLYEFWMFRLIGLKLCMTADADVNEEGKRAENDKKSFMYEDVHSPHNTRHSSRPVRISCRSRSMNFCSCFGSKVRKGKTARACGKF